MSRSCQKHIPPRSRTACRLRYSLHIRSRSRGHSRLVPPTRCSRRIRSPLGSRHRSTRRPIPRLPRGPIRRHRWRSRHPSIRRWLISTILRQLAFSPRRLRVLEQRACTLRWFCGCQPGIEPPRVRCQQHTILHQRLQGLIQSSILYHMPFRARREPFRRRRKRRRCHPRVVPPQVRREFPRTRRLALRPRSTLVRSIRIHRRSTPMVMSCRFESP